MQMEKQIYILLSHSGSILSKLINIYTRKSYTHVSLGLDKDLDELYSFGRLRPYNPVLGGFIKEDILNGTYNRFPNTKCALYILTVTEEQYERLGLEIERFKKDQERYKYNILGLVGIMINRPVNREYSYFCSQFVSEVLSNSGINIIQKTPSLTCPVDFLECKELEIIYEGQLNQYNLKPS